MREALTALFSPGSVAIVGDSPGGGRGAMMRHQLERVGYTGVVHSVNPKYSDIHGRPCYASVSAIGSPVDAVLVAVSAPRAVATVREAGECGAKAAVVIASGFTEAGPDGARLQAELREVADRFGMAVCGPNCYGVVNLVGGFAGYGGLTPAGLRSGGTAILMQSGALTHALLNPASLRGLGVSHLVTTGNEAVLRLGDFVQHAVDDPDTSVIACFIEGLRDPGRFADALVGARQAGKPVVICKTGRSEAARVAAVAHTGAIAGSDDAFDALCEATGAIRVDDLDQLIEACLLLQSGRHVREPVVFASISGGGSGVMADLCAREGLQLAEFRPETVAGLRAVLPDFANVNNPLDLTGAVAEQPDLVTQTTSALGAAREVRTVAFALNTPTADDEFERSLYQTMLTDAAAGLKGSDVSFVPFTMTSGPMDRELLDAASACEAPLLMGMQETIAVMARSARSRRSQRPGWRRAPGSVSSGDGTCALSESESKEMLQKAGVSVPQLVHVDSAEDAVQAASGLGYPVVIKADSRAIPHKTEAGCVRTGLDTADAVDLAFREVRAAAERAAGGAPFRITVTQMVPEGLDLVVGGLAVPEIGHLLVVGLGGTLVELQVGAQRALTPVSLTEAEEMLDAEPFSRLLGGYRGAAALDVTAAAGAITAVSSLLVRHTEVVELDVNPLRVLPEGHGALALDALVVVTGSAVTDQ